MADGNGQTGLRGKLLQLYLPQSAASPIGTASISKDEQLVAAGIESLSHALPPPSDAFHGKLGGLMVNAQHSQTRCCGPDHRCQTEPLSRLRGSGNHRHSPSSPALWLAILSRCS